MGVTLVVFFLLHASGNPASIMLGEWATPEQVALFNQAYGLDKPFFFQFGSFLFHALQGDFGNSILEDAPALEVVLHSLPNTIILATVSTVIALAISIPAGIIAAWKRNSLFDFLLMGGAVLGQSLTQFWLGLMLMLIFAVKLQWLPSSGIGEGIGMLRHMILPVITLAPFFQPLQPAWSDQECLR